jgi:hypothetical protein
MYNLESFQTLLLFRQWQTWHHSLRISFPQEARNFALSLTDEFLELDRL